MGWQHFTLDQSKVLGNDGSPGLRDKFGMAFRVDGCLVDPGVQGRVIDVLDFFPRSRTVVQLDGVGPSTAKGISGVERVGQLEIRHIVADIFSLLFQLLPPAFPHFHHTIPLGSKQLRPFLGERVCIVYP